MCKRKSQFNYTLKKLYIISRKLMAIMMKITLAIDISLVCSVIRDKAQIEYITLHY